MHYCYSLSLLFFFFFFFFFFPWAIPVPFTPLIELFGIYKMFKMLNDVGIFYSCQILLLYGAKTNKTLV